VANKANPRARMVETDTASRQNRRPDLVAHGFQVIACAIEPISSRGNLFAKDDARATCKDEAPEVGPHISRNRAASRRARAQADRPLARQGPIPFSFSRDGDGAHDSRHEGSCRLLWFSGAFTIGMVRGRDTGRSELRSQPVLGDSLHGGIRLRRAVRAPRHAPAGSQGTPAVRAAQGAHVDHAATS
jgi:hypothetical protein